MDGLRQGTVHRADSQSERGAHEDHLAEPTQGNSLLNVTANSDVSLKGPERKELSKESLLQPTGLLGMAAGCAPETNCSTQPKSHQSEDPRKAERLVKTPNACESEGVQKAALEVSENKGNQVLQPGAKVDVEEENSQTSHKEIQVIIVMSLFSLICRNAPFCSWVPCNGI